MIIRAYDPSKDADRIRELYTHRAPDRRLDPLNPLNFASVVVEDDEGKIVGFMVARPFANVHTVVDDDFGSRADRFRMISDMTRDIAGRLLAAGFAEAAFQCPPPYDRMGDKFFRISKGITKVEDPNNYEVRLAEYLDSFEGK